MTNFAFIVHPFEINNIYSVLPYTKLIPKRFFENILIHLPPFKISTININKKNVHGYFIVCPLLPRHFFCLDEKIVLEKIISAVSKGEKMGAEIIGLGAFTSVVGDKGITIAKKSNASITTGNSLTVAVVIEACKRISKYRNLDLKNSIATIIGATGSIGSACSKMLAELEVNLILSAPKKEKLLILKKNIRKINKNIDIKIEISPIKAVKNSDITIIASSSPKTILSFENFKKNSIVCDISTPSNISNEKLYKKNEVYYFKGGLVKLPNYININTNIGLPYNSVYACMAETFLLSIEELKENYSLGNHLPINKIKKIYEIALKHDFQPLLPPLTS